MLPPFQTLLDEHAAPVMAVLRGAVGPADAEDCFQETFLAALRAYPKLRDADNLRGWLLTIAHRKAIDHHRANGRRPLPITDMDGAETTRTHQRAKAGETRHASMALDGERLSADDGILVDIPWEDGGIWARVGALPPKQRAAVALRYACDLPHAEIAAALDCSPEAARRSLHEGMKRLRSELTNEAARKEERNANR